MMTNKRDKRSVFLPDEIRLTKFGKFLISSSWDEFTSSWYIFKGNLSLVGPRPFFCKILIFVLYGTSWTA